MADAPRGRPSRRAPRAAGRPTRADLEAAAGRTVADVARPGLRVLFCGINPGLWSAAVGLHFARPGNRFWKALYAGGFTGRVLDPAEQSGLPDAGLGITNLVERATAGAADLTTAELRAGAARLEARAADLRPAWVAVLGMDAYRRAFARPGAGIGAQAERLAGAGLWVLPNPSGAQARYQLDDLGRLFGELRAAAATA